ncbi:hypothetical protein EVJ58_g9240 [Rhodofomes roseus]|uniref:Integrase catalytic domain-containing protein n=1 Tax=Rhodofomes roseus TaxID=34475 RepID=A0A4Y9XWP4_9APHY|nr:hypothetical protein EVJ58_g9240 [Rhodofomes roseus]
MYLCDDDEPGTEETASAKVEEERSLADSSYTPACTGNIPSTTGSIDIVPLYHAEGNGETVGDEREKEGGKDYPEETFEVHLGALTHVLAYKKVARKVRPVATTLPEEFRVVRREVRNALEGLPELPTRAGEFEPRGRYTEARREKLDVRKDGFLWEEEAKLVDWLVAEHEKAFAWDETEKGRLTDEYFDPVVIPAVEHIPWAHKNIPIPPGIYDEVVQIIKDKIASGVYEPSSSSYRSRWFCVVKKDGKSLRLVHDLQPLNAVTIKDSSVPPFVEQLAESFGGRACYGSLDLFVAFDQRTLDARSRDLTTFQSPLGALRLTSVPMGWTNAMQIVHGDVTFILRDEIPGFTIPFVDDAPVKGPKTRYEIADGGYETIEGNGGIRRFVWEHLQVMNRILHRMKRVGGTFSGKKAYICVPDIVVVGHKCTYEGRVPEEGRIQRIRDWPPCQSVTEVRGFLGTMGLVRIFVKDFAKLAKPLTRLTKREVDFEWGSEEERAMKLLKDALIDSPALLPIDYTSERAVILAVDSSIIGVGYVLLQLDEAARRRPSRFGSITWNERESNYSQPKVELYGLFRALRASRIHIIGVKALVVEVDAKYIKGMLNNPDIQPNATINRWIAGILLFDFKLVHVPGDKHSGADGLSRRRRADEDPEEEDDHEQWIDDACGFAVFYGNTSEPSVRRVGWAAREERRVMCWTVERGGGEEVVLPRNDATERQDEELEVVQRFLQDVERPEGMDDLRFKKLVKRASQFFLRNERLWRRDPEGKHKRVISYPRRLGLLREAHDDLGHKGIFTVRRRILERFWWPNLERDVKWYVGTCHECQLRSMQKVKIPPTVATPLGLFQKVHIDTMHMPKAGGFSYLVQARCSMSSYPEWRKLRTETAITLAKFIYEDILCRWGAVSEIVTDNGTAFLAAMKELEKRYGIRHIKISPYNSRANGIVERRHTDVREAAMKICGGNEAKWPSVIDAVFWAERVSIQKSTGMSPYRIVHGVEPLLPFDLAEATYLVPLPEEEMSTRDLLAMKAQQLLKRREDLDAIHAKVLAGRYKSVREFIKRNEHVIKDYDHKRGDLVLVRNSQIETEHNRKAKRRYSGPMVVVRRTEGGAYILAELDGSVSRHRYAAFRVIPYRGRSRSSVRLEEVEEWEEYLPDENEHYGDRFDGEDGEVDGDEE